MSDFDPTAEDEIPGLKESAEAAKPKKLTPAQRRRAAKKEHREIPQVEPDASEPPEAWEPPLGEPSLESLVDVGAVTPATELEPLSSVSPEVVDAAWERTARLHSKLGFEVYDSPDVRAPLRGKREITDRMPSAVARVYREADALELRRLLQEHGFPLKVVDDYAGQRERAIAEELKALENPAYASLVAGEADREKRMELVRKQFLEEYRKRQKKA